MKRINQFPEPAALAAFRTRRPGSTWDEMRDDAIDGGMAAYRSVKSTTLAQQRCLCAFCEMKDHNVVPDAETDQKITNVRIEHFHPKGDSSAETNWHLMWTNLWAVCFGGDNWPPMAPPDHRHRVMPRHENLSCDAFKNGQVERGRLSAKPEGWILSPDLIPAFPCLFKYTTSGNVEPDSTTCQQVAIPGNRLGTTTEIVQNTITHLNLNCTRLSRLRSEVMEEVDEYLAGLREADPHNGRQIVAEYAANIFSPNPKQPWPEFFSLYRWLLGDAAEQRLQEIGFAG